jgi:hypothetical protein
MNLHTQLGAIVFGVKTEETTAVLAKVLTLIEIGTLIGMVATAQAPPLVVTCTLDQVFFLNQKHKQCEH